MPLLLNQSDASFDADFEALLNARSDDAPAVRDTVSAIIADVKARGDVALIKYTQRFDHCDLTAATIEISTAPSSDSPKLSRHGQECRPPCF